MSLLRSKRVEEEFGESRKIPAYELLIKYDSSKPNALIPVMRRSLNTGISAT